MKKLFPGKLNDKARFLSLEVLKIIFGIVILNQLNCGHGPEGPTSFVTGECRITSSNTSSTPDNLNLFPGESADVMVVHSIQSTCIDILIYMIVGPEDSGGLIVSTDTVHASSNQLGCTVTVEVPPGTTSGKYSVVLEARVQMRKDLRSDPYSAYDTLEVNVISPSDPSFTIALASTSLTIEQGDHDTMSVFINRINSYEDTISLWLKGNPSLPNGIAGSFSPNPVPVNAMQSTMTIANSYYLPTGDYNLEVWGNFAPEIQKSNSFTLHVIPSTKTFSVSVSEDTLKIQQGTSAQTTVTVDRMGRYNLAIDLTMMELIGGYIDASFNPAVLNNPQTTSILTISPRNTATPNHTYGILVCGEHFSGSMICDTLYITVTSQSSANWSPINSPTSNNLRALSFINENKGWVVGDFGEIWKYDNGSWENQSVAGARNFDVHFTDEMTGTIVGDFQRVLRTFDGGQTWTDSLKPDQPIPDYLYGVYFTDANNGWVVGGSSLIYHTSDGGDTWVKQTPQVEGRFRRVHFTSGTNGVIVGQASSNETLILYTTNSGQNWLKSNYTSTLSSGNILGIDFISGSIGFCGGGTQIYFTQDGGISWKEQIAPLGSNIYGMACGDVNNIWAVGTATLLRTTNGGSQWDREVQINSFLLDATFFNSTVGYTVGMNGVIMKRE